MNHYVKNFWDEAGPNSMPEFSAQRETFKCPHCHRQVDVVVPPTSIDWESVANQYRDYSRKMWMECNLILSESGCDTLLQRKLEEILAKCKQALGIET